MDKINTDDLSADELRDLKLAVTRAMDSLGPNEKDLLKRFDALYKKLRFLIATA